MKTLVALRDKKIEDQEADVERFKQVAEEMTEEKEKERKERIETIFMYESRIKGRLQGYMLHLQCNYTVLSFLVQKILPLKASSIEHNSLPFQNELFPVNQTFFKNL